PGRVPPPDPRRTGRIGRNAAVGEARGCRHRPGRPAGRWQGRRRPGGSRRAGQTGRDPEQAPAGMTLENVEEVLRLSHTQSGMLFHSAAEPDAGVYVAQISCTLVGTLDVAAFKG